MQEPYQWYVLYVRTSAENRVVHDIARFVGTHDFSPYEIEPFCPESEAYYRSGKAKAQKKSYRRLPLFAGYVFIETTMPADEFLSKFGQFIHSSPDIIRILKYGSGNNIALPDVERMRLEYLLRGKRCLEHSVGYVIGDKVYIAAGPLVGSEGLITYINRHNRYADIELELFGGKVKARAALEIVEKISATDVAAKACSDSD